MNNIYVDKTLDTYVIKQEIKDLKGKKYRWVQIFLPETDFVQVLSLTDRLAEERKKVVQEIRETIFEYLKVNSMEDLQKLSLLASTLTYDVITDKLDQIERGE